MGQSIFQFKQFTIIQENAAMKVCTDSCLFGALAHFPNARTVLDIGTGTGLLSLMLAQRHPQTTFTAIEIMAEAALQAKENVENSPFKNQIEVLAMDVNDYNSPTQFDGIICNPPFFQSNLKSPNFQRNHALHDESLSLEALANHINRLLVRETGTCWILLPEYEQSLLAKLFLTYGLYPIENILVHNTAGGKVIRVISKYTFQNTEVQQRPMIIKDAASNTYSAEFHELLKDYYLYL